LHSKQFDWQSAVVSHSLHACREVLHPNWQVRGVTEHARPEHARTPSQNATAGQSVATTHSAQTSSASTQVGVGAEQGFGRG
jgi:hypothetical protein